MSPQITQVRKSGPKSYPAGGPIRAGRLVEAHGADVRTAEVESPAVLGVALNDAVTILVTDPVDGVLDTAPTGTRVNVAHGIEAPVTYEAAAAFGDKLVAATSGTVRPALSDPDARTIVGQCTQLGGVTAGEVGLAWIY